MIWILWGFKIFFGFVHNIGKSEIEIESNKIIVPDNMR